MKKSLIIVLAVLALAAVWVFSSYNSLVSVDEGVKNKWADVETQYQRRMDLIPNVVNTVKGSANFEQSTLQAVVEARSAWANAKASRDINAETAAAQSFDSALSRLLVTVEAYPNLKSTEAFRDLTTELEGTENRVAVARRDFNAAVKDYNLVIRRFPSNLVAKIFNFDLRSSFEATNGAEKAPEVKF
ncbi:MAG: LemA family protein [Candidatus Niyogibacteria bacterium]|nr:LemA family protein [Candidatus Niyogibacteria bacterium]